MITLLLALLLMFPINSPAAEQVENIAVAPIVREVETPARFFSEVATEDTPDYQSIFWSNPVENVKTVKVCLPEGELIKISAWDGDYPEGDEHILYLGGSSNITREVNVPCTQIAVYSTGSVLELKCYVVTQ